MSQQRIGLSVKIFGLGLQPASVLANLKPSELVAEILEEFRADLPYLSNRPADYALCLEKGNVRLDDQVPLNLQRLGDQVHLVLVEREIEQFPENARPLKESVYLRELESGMVYRLGWQPAIIGRPNLKMADNALLAVNLEAYPSAQSVSRLHAYVTEEAGQFYIENRNLSNPLSVIAEKGQRTQVEQERHPLNPNDQILFNKSHLRLLFLRNI